MGKNFCKVEGKWCKRLKRGICDETKTPLNEVRRCPRLEKIETVRLADLLKEVSFDPVFYRLCHYFPSQESSREAYEKVFNKLCLMTPKKHRLDDLFIEIHKVHEEDDGSEWLNVSGQEIIKENPISYGIEFSRWIDWVSMFITQETLDSLSKEDIVAGCLYEMTFFGFEEEDVVEEKEKIFNSIEEAKNSLKNKKK